jgi:hypothetical protein
MVVRDLGDARAHAAHAYSSIADPGGFPNLESQPRPSEISVYGRFLMEKIFDPRIQATKVIQSLDGYGLLFISIFDPRIL